MAAQAASTVDAQRIQQELESLSFSDIGALFEAGDGEDGQDVVRVLPITRWPKAARAAIAGVKVKRYLEGPRDNQREVETLEFKLWNKGDGLRQLREHMGLVKPPGEVNVILGVIAMPMVQAPVPPSDVLARAEGAQVVTRRPPAALERLRAIAGTL